MVQAPTASDGVQNQDESDVDCGGSNADKCTAGKKCGQADDCQSGLCQSGICQVSWSQMTGWLGRMAGDLQVVHMLHCVRIGKLHLGHNQPCLSGILIQPNVRHRGFSPNILSQWNLCC